MQSKFDSENKVWIGPSHPFPFKPDFMVGDLVYSKLSENPEQVLQISESDGSKMTRGDLKLNSTRIAQNLMKNGIKADDIVCLFLKQKHFTTYVINGCVFIGAVLFPCQIASQDEDISYLLNKIKPKIIIAESEYVPKLDDIIKELEFEVPMYVTGDDTHHPSALDFLRETNEEENFILPKFTQPSNEKLLAIVCSSGTTGRPKGVRFYHTGILTWGGSQASNRVIETVSTSYSPVSWSSGFFRNMTVGLSRTDLFITPDHSFSVESFMEMCEKYQITNVMLQSSLLASLLNSNEFLNNPPKSLKSFFSVGSILSTKLRKTFEEYFPTLTLRIFYGCTEAGGMLSFPDEYKKELAVGSLMYANTTFKISDDEGKGVENGIHGEICIKKHSKLFGFDGYYNDPEATKNAVDADGYFKTGDIGYFDENGMLYVIGPMKHKLIYKEHHINSSEIESFIEAIDGVQQVAVVGIPDDLTNTLLAAAIVKAQGFDALTEKDVMDYVKSKLPIYKHLHGGVYFFDKLPMTASGKIVKKLVLQDIINMRT